MNRVVLLILPVVLMLFGGVMTAHAAFQYDSANSVYVMPYQVPKYLYGNAPVFTYPFGTSGQSTSCDDVASWSGNGAPYCVTSTPRTNWSYSCEGGICSSGWYSGWFVTTFEVDFFTSTPTPSPASGSIVCEAYDDTPVGAYSSPWPNSGCSTYFDSTLKTTATLTANPTSISAGNASSLTWSGSPNATSCTGTNFNTGGAPSGTISVSPGSTTTYSVTCTGPGGTSNPATATVTVTAPQQPSVALSANPTNITQGDTSTLTWSSSNATSCVGSGGSGTGTFSTGNAPSGSVAVTPSSTTNYSITCTGPGGTSQPATATVTVTTAPLTFTCAPNPSSIQTGQTAKWVAAWVSGGTGYLGTYTYSWSGTDGLTGTAQSATQLYTTAGTKTASVTVTSGSQSATFPCSPSLTVTQGFAATCSASPASPATGDSVSWRASPTSGTPPYIYSWTGDDGLSGSGSPLTKIYSTTGTKNATVTVTDSGSGSSYSWVHTGSYQTSCANAWSKPTCDAYQGGASCTAGSSVDCNANDVYCGAPNQPLQTYQCLNTSSSGPKTTIASCSVPVSAPSLPDMTATTTPTGNTAFYAGTAQTFSGFVGNLGTASGTSVPNVIQVLDSTGTTNLGYFSASTVTVGVGAYVAVSGTVTAGAAPFNTPGTYQVRVCTNKNTSGTNIITEGAPGYYGNNCGNALTVTVTAAPATLSATCSVLPTSANTGSNVTWTAYPTGGTAPYTYTWTATGGTPSTGSASSLTNSYSSPGTYSASVTVHSTDGQTVSSVPCTSNADGNGGTPDGPTVTVSTPLPDMTATTTPTGNTAFYAGTAQTFSGFVGNLGTASGTSVPNVIQVLDSTGTTNLGYFSASTVTVGVGAYVAVSGTVTAGAAPFNTPGTYQVRVCTNKNTSGTNIITEGAPGFYGNNCGNALTVTVTAAPATLSATCSVLPTSANTGSNVTWTAYPTGGTAPYTYTWTATGGTPSTGSASSLTNSYSSPGTYSASVTVHSTDGQTVSSVPCTSNADGNGGTPDGPTVTVSPAPTGFLTVTPSTAQDYGNNYTLTYSCSNSTLAGIDNGALATTSTMSGGPVVTPTTTTTYRLSCQNGAGTIASYTATALVTPRPDFTASTTPTGATSFNVGSPQTFNGIVGNIGTASGTNVPNVIKILNASGNAALAYAVASPATNSIAANGGILAVSGSFTATTTGTYLVEFCANQDTNGTIVQTEKAGGYGNNCSSPLSVTVGVATAPDIRGDGAPPQTAATVNVSQNFTGTVTNIGSATGTNFPNVLQILDSTGTTNIARVLVSPNPLTLAGGTTTSATLTGAYTFTSAGTYKVRICGNMDTSGTNIITEGSGQYGNNCGAPQTVTVSGASAASVASCTPLPSTAATGTPITWTVATSSGTFVPAQTTQTWSVSGGSPANQTGTPATFTSSFAVGGDYSPTVTATNGTQTSPPFSCSPVHINGNTDTCSAGVTPVITSSQTRVTSGSPVVISWSATGVSAGTTCTVTGANVGGTGVNITTTTTSDNLCNISNSTNTVTIPSVTTQQVYSITCSGVTKQVIVNIIPTIREF